MINIIGIKNNRCLISSYKFTFSRIKRNKIENMDKESEPNNITFNLFEKIFFSIKGNIKIPTKIIIGNLKKNQIGIYDDGRL